MDFWCKMLKPVNGCAIEKSAELTEDGKIKPGTYVYTVYPLDDDNCLIGCYTSLKEAQQEAREYMPREEWTRK